MKTQTGLIVFLLSLILTGVLHASDGEQEIQKASDHFLLYTMGLAGGVTVMIINCHNFNTKMMLINKHYPDYNNPRNIKIFVMLQVLIGAGAGAGVGYVLEYIFREYE